MKTGARVRGGINEREGEERKVSQSKSKEKEDIDTQAYKRKCRTMKTLAVEFFQEFDNDEE